MLVIHAFCAQLCYLILFILYLYVSLFKPPKICLIHQKLLFLFSMQYSQTTPQTANMLNENQIFLIFGEHAREQPHKRRICTASTSMLAHMLVVCGQCYVYSLWADENVSGEIVFWRNFR